MQDTYYLIFNAERITRMSKNLPPLETGEYATRISLTVPDGFEEYIYPIVDVNVPPEALIGSEISVTAEGPES